jgi:hypothetical protein
MRMASLCADHVERNGCALQRRGQRARPGGNRAKLKIGRYTRRETTWVKIKNPRHSQAERRRELFERRLGE